MSTAFAKYVNNWLNDAYKEKNCTVVLWVDGVIPYTLVNWEEGIIHLVRKHDGNHEMFINTNNTGFIRFEKEYK